MHLLWLVRLSLRGVLPGLMPLRYRNYYISVGIRNFLSFVYVELFEVSITVNLVGIKVFSLQKFLFRYSS